MLSGADFQGNSEIAGAGQRNSQRTDLRRQEEIRGKKQSLSILGYALTFFISLPEHSAPGLRPAS